MPKIDISKIQNYENMTAEEKVKALEAYEFEVDNSDVERLKTEVERLKTEVERLKTAVSKANSEAAEWKKKHHALLSEEERKEAERLEAQQALEKENAELRKDKAVFENKSRFLGLGYDEKLALETAKALVDGDMEKVFANQAKHIENIRKAERMATLAAEPKPPAGAPGGTVEITKEQFDAMNYSERLKLFNEQPEIYKKFTEG
jgi:predicted RNase H-like nuclease (RuvC/YqgF family)